MHRFIIAFIIITMCTCGGGDTTVPKGDERDFGFDGLYIDFSGSEQGDKEGISVDLIGEIGQDILSDKGGDIEHEVEKLTCDQPPYGFGCECSGPDDCISGLCIDVEYGKICSTTCTDKCPDGFSCLQVSGQRDVMFICLPKFSKLCQPCKQHLDCQAKGAQGVSVCVDYGKEGSFCGVVCKDASDCPNGYTCKDMTLGDGSPTKQCVKDKCECNTLGKALGMSTYCFVSNNIGQCKGERQCLADGLSSCNAPIPSKEECDLKDNDCNGITDDLPEDALCYIENEYGKCTGKKTCVGGKEVCLAETPKPEICDGLDNNCNNFTDEGYDDTDKDKNADCIDPDDDNDGVPDEKDNCVQVMNPDQSDIDGDGKGDICDIDMDGDGFPNDIDCNPKDSGIYPGAPEVCDGKDNNCNDKIDEGLCDDGISCTFDYCDILKGICNNAPDDSKCQDNNPCTQDKCEKGKGCVQIPISGPECDDQNPCTFGDTCKDGVCVGTQSPGCCKTSQDCDDKNPCTIDVCDLASGKCTYKPAQDGTPCDADGNGCTQDDKCMGGACIAGQAVVCQTGDDPCVKKVCKSIGVNSFICDTIFSDKTVPCDDGLFCTVSDHCDGNGKCVGGSQRDCGGGPGACLDAVCSEAQKKCITNPKADGTPCNADNNGCTVGDVCSGGDCIPGQEVDCKKYSDACNKGQCKSLAEDLYVCEKIPLPKGTPCDDGQFCTSGESCDGNGACIGGEPRDCAKEVGDQCNGGYCDEMAKVCVKTKKPDNTPCDDGNVCTLTDICMNGLCQGQDNACVEERINVAGPGARRPQMGSLGYGRYVTQWVGAGEGQNYMRLSDGTGSRENEEVKLSGNQGSQWSTRIAVQESGDFVVMKWEGPSSGNWQSCAGGSFVGYLYAVKYRYDGYKQTEKLVRSFTGVKDYCCLTTSATIASLRAIPLSFSDGTFAQLDSVHWNLSGCGVSGNPTHLDVRFAPMASDLSPGSTTVLLPASKVGGADRWDASVVPDGSDNFLLAWVDASKAKVYVQRFLKTGQPDTPQEFLVHDAGKEIFQVRVLGFKDSKFIVVFDVADLDGSGRGIYAQRFYPDGTKLGQLFKVNQQINGDQNLGDIARFSDNGFVIVYDDQKGDTNGYAVKAMRYDSQGKALGSEITINTTYPGDQYQPSVITLSSDEWVVSFINNTDKSVWTRRFYKDGTPSMGKVEMKANVTVKGAQTNPKAALSSNNVMIVWESPIFGKEVSEVMGRIFDVTGKEIKGEFQVNTYDKDSQSSPAIAGGPDRFIVVWDSVGQDGSVDGIFGQLFYGDGKVLGKEFQINKTTADFQRQPSVAMASTGQFMVAWNGYSQAAGSTSDIFAKIFDKDGQTLADEFMVNSNQAKPQEKPFVVSAPTKAEFVVAWESKDQDGSGLGLFMRKFSVSGQALSDEVQVNTTTGGDQKGISLAISPDTKRILACWESFGQDAPNTWGVVCQFFNYADLTLAGTEFIPHALKDGAQQSPSVAYLNNGEVLVAWSSEGVDSQGLGIQLQKYSGVGETIGPRLVANRYWIGNQQRPFIVPLQNLSYFIGWQSDGQDGDSSGVYFRILPSQ